jgi:iron complex outermembrane receptor protein
VVNTQASQFEYRAAPQRQFNAFGDYIFGNSGFDISGGISYTSAYMASNIGDIVLPSALTFSADIGYRRKKWEVRLSGANLTSVISFYPTSGGAAIIPNPTRTITMKYTYKF